VLGCATRSTSTAWRLNPWGRSTRPCSQPKRRSGRRRRPHGSSSWGRDGISTHPALQPRTAEAQSTSRDREQAFDRLNPDYGIPADPHNPHGHQALRDRKAALALGTRVAVASSRENDPNPVMWVAGQDYRAADATRTAHFELGRSRRDPERLGAER